MKLETAIEYMNAAGNALDPALCEHEVGSFVIDSRETRSGGVFFALSQPEYKDNGFNGDFEDSTQYVRSAFELGALACVVRRDRFEEHINLRELQDRLIFVDDAILALQKLAYGVYKEWNEPVVAITGSAGKTTAREITAHLLAKSGLKPLTSKKNYNNGLGHPLTVLELVADSTYDVAVLEMGMSTPMNEIARLCRITPPDVAVVLNVLPVHLEHLGTIKNIAAAKTEIITGMKKGGTAVLNADDRHTSAMAKKTNNAVITFGIENDADIRASNIKFNAFGETKFTLAMGKKTAPIAFPLNGRHNILNALAATAVAVNFGIEIEEIEKNLSTIAAPVQRGEVLRYREGFTVINDSYNSNPDALLSMVETLVDGAGDGRKIVVAGEMLELGNNAQRIHYITGQKIAESGVDKLIGVRGLADEMVRGALDAGLRDSIFTEDTDAAADIVVKSVKSGDVVLIKGSRGVKTEKVIEKLLEKFNLDEPEQSGTTRQSEKSKI